MTKIFTHTWFNEKDELKFSPSGVEEYFEPGMLTEIIDEYRMLSEFIVTANKYKHFDKDFEKYKKSFKHKPKS